MPMCSQQSERISNLHTVDDGRSVEILVFGTNSHHIYVDNYLNMVLNDIQ